MEWKDMPSDMTIAEIEESLNRFIALDEDGKCAISNGSATDLTIGVLSSWDDVPILVEIVEAPM